MWGKILPSLVGIRTLTKQERNMIKLPPFQYNVIIGLILSDGWIRYVGASKNAQLGFCQSYEHFDYIYFVFSILSHYCSKNVTIRSINRFNKIYHSLEFNTRNLSCFNEFYSLFYENGKKIVPVNIYELLTPEALAHIIMGDGSAKSHGLMICTDSFSIPDIIRLMNVLMIKYRLNCTLRSHTPTQHRIYISQDSMDNLRNIVSPFMQSSMMYKIGK